MVIADVASANQDFNFSIRSSHFEFPDRYL